MNVGWEEIVNIIVIFQLLAFTAFLFIKKTPYISNYILGIHLFSQACGIFYSLQELQKEIFLVEQPHFYLTSYPFVFLWGPTFYFYIRSIVYRDFKFKLAHLLHLIPFAVVLLFFSFTFYFHNAETKRVILNDSSYLFFSKYTVIDLTLRLQILFYIIQAFIIYFSVKKRLKENYSTISKTNLSWLTFLVFGYTVCYVISVLLIYSNYYLEGFTGGFMLANFLQFFVYFNIIFYKAWDQPEIFKNTEEAAKYRYSKLNADDNKHLTGILSGYMAEHKPYLNPDLTLAQLAEDTGINRRILSQVINDNFKQTFYDYINQLRIEESKKKLTDPTSNKNVLETLYETGFNSKATFNRVFKKETGLSPTEYRKKFMREY